METKTSNYEIDGKLKEGKDYPPDLPLLIGLFNGDRLPLGAIWKKRNGEPSRSAIAQFRKEISLIERTFKVFFLIRSRMAEVERHYDPGLINLNKSPHEPQSDSYTRERKKFPEEWINDFRSETGSIDIDISKWIKKVESIKKLDSKSRPDPINVIIDDCIKRVNAKIHYLPPRISLEPLHKGKVRRCSLLHPVRIADFRGRKDLGWAYPYWMRLARTMVEVDPRLVHQCPYCRNIFFSRQRKRFHSECRSIFFSKKYKEKGFNKEWCKGYRKRKKKRRRL